MDADENWSSFQARDKNIRKPLPDIFAHRKQRREQVLSPIYHLGEMYNYGEGLHCGTIPIKNVFLRYELVKISRDGVAAGLNLPQFSETAR